MTTWWNNYSGALRERSIFADPSYNAALDAKFFSELAMAGTEGLARQVTAQRQQIRDLSMLVAQMAVMLKEAGVIDLETLVRNTEDKIAAARARNDATCMQCNRVVPVGHTQITENGTICDRCAAGVK